MIFLSYKSLNAEIIIKQAGAYCCVKAVCSGKMTRFFSINDGDWKYFYGKKFDFAFVDYRIIATFEPFSVC